MSRTVVGYAPPVLHVRRPRLGRGWARLRPVVRRRRRTPVYAVRVPLFTDIPPT